MSYAVYVYSDSSGSQEKIRADALNWTGTWSSTGTYYAATSDSVLYGNDRYIAVADNVGVNPTAQLRNPVRRNPFSPLIVWQPGDEPPFSPPDAPSLAYTALTTAWQGTAAAATANAALATGYAGTVTFYVAAAYGGAGTVQITAINGIITGVSS